MGKLIIGIAAVICLDIGFVAFVATDRVTETAQAVVATPSEVVPEHNFPDLELAELHPIIEDDFVVIKTASAPAPKRIARRRISGGIAANRYETFDTNFKDVVIYYNVYSPTNERSNGLDTMASKGKSRPRSTAKTPRQAVTRQLVASIPSKPSSLY